MMQDTHMKLKPQLPWQSWIKNWNQQPAEVLGALPCKPKIFRELGKQLLTRGSERNRSVVKII